jgi:hypothetical protein
MYNTVLRQYSLSGSGMDGNDSFTVEEEMQVLERDI